MLAKLQELKTEYLRLVAMDPSWINRMDIKEQEMDDLIAQFVEKPDRFNSVKSQIEVSIASRITVNTRKGLM